MMVVSTMRIKNVAIQSLRQPRQLGTAKKFSSIGPRAAPGPTTSATSTRSTKASQTLRTSPSGTRLSSLTPEARNQACQGGFFLKMDHSRPVSSLFSSFQYSFLIVLIVYNIAYDWIRTADL